MDAEVSFTNSIPIPPADTNGYRLNPPEVDGVKPVSVVGSPLKL